MFRNYRGIGGRGGSAALLALVLGTASPALAQLTPTDIEALRKQGEREGWTFQVVENEATHYSLDELCGFFKPKDWKDLAHWDSCPPRRDLPSVFDWRDQGGCPPVRNQGGCGSCWAFSTVGPLECNIKIKDGITVNLSEQWLVSCNQDGWGCGGGFFAHNYHEWKNDPCGDTGAVMESDFPYVAYDAPCNCPYDHEYLIEDWAYISGGTSAIKQAIMDYGPVSVDVYANSAMQAYGGGIFNGCQSGVTNHAVVLVGWDDNQGSGGVWFMRNSWGSYWGEDGGYMRIPYGCSNIADSACYVVYGGPIPRLTFEYPNGRPEMLDPGTETRIRVNVLADTSTPVPGTGQVHYSLNGGAYTTTAMDVVGTNQYEAVLPPAGCFDRYDWYVSAQESGGMTLNDPIGAPTDTYSAVVATGTVVLFEDDFETDQGWTVYAAADTGNWERANPEGVWYSYLGLYTQPEDDHTPSGTRCYVTGAAAGSGVGSNDVDGGPTRLTSPVLDLAGTDGVVSYWRWFHISTQWDDELKVWVSNDNGGSWTRVEVVADREEWTYVQWRVGDYVTPTSQVLVRFTIRDDEPGSLIEALVDDFKVEALECVPPEQYTLTVYTDGDGVVMKDPDQATYSYGQVVELEAWPDSGWSFDHWSGDLGGSSNPTTITMDGDQTVTGHFTQNQYTLTITTDGSGSVSKLPDQATYTYGQVVELTANADPGWTFDHWSGDLSGSDNPETITMQGDATVTAHFVEEIDDCPEDLNGDEHIGIEDLSALLANYGQSGMGPADGDFDGDGDVDIQDLSQLLGVYGQDCPTR